KQSKLLADISRFIYMQEKMRHHRQRFPAETFDYSYLMPYPGPYVDGAVDLPAHAVAALNEKYPQFSQTHKPEDYVDKAVAQARVKAAEFFDYRVRWRRTLADLTGNSRFRSVCASAAMAKPGRGCR